MADLARRQFRDPLDDDPSSNPYYGDETVQVTWRPPAGLIAEIDRTVDAYNELGGATSRNELMSAIVDAYLPVTSEQAERLLRRWRRQKAAGR